MGHKTIPASTSLLVSSDFTALSWCLYSVRLCRSLSHVWLCDLVVCNPPASSVHGILQARVIEWVAIPFSRGSSQPRDWTQVSCIAGRFFTIWATREAQCSLRGPQHLQCYPSLCLVFITEFKYFWKRREEGLRTLQIPQTQLQYEGSLAI